MEVLYPSADEDFKAYNKLISQMNEMVCKLEDEYGNRLAGSPSWGDVLMDFHRSDPTNPDFQKGKELVDEFENLNIAISSTEDRCEAFLRKIR